MATKIVKDLSEYTADEIKQYGEEQLKKKLAQRKKQKEQFVENKPLTYARKRLSTVRKTLEKNIKRAVECAKQERLQVQAANRRAKMQANRGSAARLAKPKDTSYERFLFQSAIKSFEELSNQPEVSDVEEESVAEDEEQPQV